MRTDELKSEVDRQHAERAERRNRVVTYRDRMAHAGDYYDRSIYQKAEPEDSPYYWELYFE